MDDPDYDRDYEDRVDEANLRAERRARGVEGIIGPSDEWEFSEGFWS